MRGEKRDKWREKRKEKRWGKGKELRRLDK